MALLSLGDGPGRKPWLNPQAGRPKAVPKRKGFTKELPMKFVYICLSHNFEDGMAERITAQYPKVTHIKFNGPKCVACLGKV